MRPAAILFVALFAAPASADDAPAPRAEPPAAPEPAGNGVIRLPNGLVVRYYRVNYVSADILARQLESWLAKAPDKTTARGSVRAEGPATTVPGTPVKDPPAPGMQTLLRIEDTEENWPVLQRVLDTIDVPQPQLIVDAKIVESSWTDDLKLGTEFHLKRTIADTFFRSVDVKFPNRLDAFNQFTTTFHEDTKYAAFDAIVDLAQAGAKTDVTSRPSISASQGELARIRTGDNEPIVQQALNGNSVTASTIFKDTGITLEVTPILIGRDGARVKIMAELSRVSDFRVTATSQSLQVVNPVITTRRAETLVTVPDGEEIVLGGLDYEFDRTVSTGIPLLKDIPLVGALFGSTTTRKERTSLMFFLTFRIATPGEARVILPPGESERGGR